MRLGCDPRGRLLSTPWVWSVASLPPGRIAGGVIHGQDANPVRQFAVVNRIREPIQQPHAHVTLRESVPCRVRGDLREDSLNLVEEVAPETSPPPFVPVVGVVDLAANRRVKFQRQTHGSFSTLAR